MVPAQKTIPPRIRPARHLTPDGVLVVRFADGIVVECHHDRVAGTDGDSCYVRLGPPTAGAVRDVRSVLRIARIEARNSARYERLRVEARARILAEELEEKRRAAGRVPGHLRELARDPEETAEEWRTTDFDDSTMEAL